MRSRHLVVIGLVLMSVTACAGAAQADPCEATGRDPRFGEAATAQSLEGVVELQTIAANPLPWGRSVAAVTRVWGDITVERLEISQWRLAACPASPPSDVGTVRYEFPGLAIPDVADRLFESAPAGDDALASLSDYLGPAVSFDVSATDRVMAQIQAWLFEILVGLIAIVAGVRLVLRLRRRRTARGDYLF